MSAPQERIDKIGAKRRGPGRCVGSVEFMRHLWNKDVTVYLAQTTSYRFSVQRQRKELLGGRARTPALRDRVQARFMQGIGPVSPGRFLFVPPEIISPWQLRKNLQIIPVRG